jgi:Mg2+/citrate symporter
LIISFVSKAAKIAAIKAEEERIRLEEERRIKEEEERERKRLEELQRLKELKLKQRQEKKVKLIFYFTFLLSIQFISFFSFRSFNADFFSTFLFYFSRREKQN